MFLSVYLLLLIPDDEPLLMPDDELRLIPDDEELLLYEGLESYDLLSYERVLLLSLPALETDSFETLPEGLWYPLLF